MPSVHWPTQVCIALQTLFTEQSLSTKHATHTPALQSLPPEFAHMDPSVASVVTHWPPVHSERTQSVPVAGQFEAL
jgi:hypothetical protein